MTNQQINKKDEKGWAVITGASSGIGEAFAKRLAQNGYSLILVARRKERLDVLADELRGRHGISVEVFPADLSQPGDVLRVAQRISECKNLDLLVNNAGFGQAGSFWEADAQGALDMSQVHVTATVQLTRAALPGMVARHSGGVINVSSIAAFAARRTGTLYHATKSFLNAFSEGLAAELQGSGVHIQALCPGFTVTGFHDTPTYQNFRRNSIPHFLWMTPEQVVNTSLADLRKGKIISVPGGLYRLIAFILTNSFTRPIAQFAAVHLIRRRR